MKRTFLGIVSLLVVIGSLWAAPGYKFTGTEHAITTPLPEQFDGLAQTNFFPGVFPVAVYSFSNNMAAFACGGSVLRTPEGFLIIVSEHIFPKGENHIYCVRPVQGSNTVVVGFINDIIMRSSDFNGRDIAFATLTSTQKVIVGFSEMTTNKNPRMKIEESSEVTMGKKPVTSIRSLVTGKNMRIIGYGESDITSSTNKYIAVESKNDHGYSCTAFFDEHSRLYLLSGGMPAGSEDLKYFDRQYLKKFGRPCEGIAFLTGPIILDLQ